MPSHRIVRDVHEAARDVARALAKTKAYEPSRHLRKKIEMLFAHLKRILRLDRLRLRGPNGAQFEFTFAAIAQNLRRLAKLTARAPLGVCPGAFREHCVVTFVQFGCVNSLCASALRLQLRSQCAASA